MQKTLLILLLSLTALTASSCATKVVLHPLEQTDIILVKKGESVQAPKDGAFLSDFYIKEVMQARVGK